MQIEVKVGALIMDPNSSTPIVVLKGIDSEAILPIWIGAYEANAIALEIEKVVPQRPMTHDLIRNLIVELGYRAEKVIVSDLRDNTFFASIELISEDGSNKVAMDARPSDAIALALRVDCPIFVEQNVIDISSSNQSQAPEEELADEIPAPDDWPDVIG
jgi:bifunctional DNase/RNase